MEKVFCIHYFLLVWALPIHAQVNEGTTEQLWLDFMPHFEINERLEYYGDASFRAIFTEIRAFTMVARPSVLYHLNSIVELRGGLGFSIKL
jgi:hypothetical protein